MYTILHILKGQTMHTHTKNISLLPIIFLFFYNSQIHAAEKPGRIARLGDAIARAKDAVRGAVTPDFGIATTIADVKDGMNDVKGAIQQTGRVIQDTGNSLIHAGDTMVERLSATMSLQTKNISVLALGCCAGVCAILLIKKGIEKVIMGKTLKNQDKRAKKKGIAFVATGCGVLLVSLLAIGRSEQITHYFSN
jgi:hypothetical protein